MNPTVRQFAEGLGRIALSFQSAPQGVPGRVWQQLSPWLQQLVLNATNKWLPRVTAGFPCRVPVYRNGVPVGPCSNSAVAICDVCGEPTCLDHCRVDQFGDAICYLCIMAAMQSRDASGASPPPNRGNAGWQRGEERAEPSGPGDAAVRAAYAMLGVDEKATNEEIERALKRARAKCHPDRFKSSAKKLQAEARFKELGAAYEVILAARKRDRAAA